MAYEMNEIRLSQEIFYYLLQHHEMPEKQAPVLYKCYTENENIQDLVKSQGNQAECDIQRYRDTVYLIPKTENAFLGFSKAQLKKTLCRSSALDRDYYLATFVIMVLLVEFYDGKGASSKTRDYIRVGEFQNRITERLSEGAAQYDEEAQIEKGMLFSEMKRSYEALRSSDKSNRQKTTKEGFLYHILHFLEEQHLIEYIEGDEMIKPTVKLDHFMDWNLLNQKNYQRVIQIFEGAENE